LVAGAPAKASEEALRAFLATGRIDVSGSGTCFAGIDQVEPGTYVEWSLDGRSRATRFYTLEVREVDPRAPESSLLELLDDSVRLRLRSDVPVGSCLSGGLDSSSIVALAQAQLAREGVRMRTFTFAAASDVLDETRFAAGVAGAVGVEACFTAAPGGLPEELEATIRSQDEPIGSGSIVAQRRVMALAHEHGAKVLLDGQGGDEVLAGYSYYRAARLADL